DAFRMEPFDWSRNDECRMVRAGLALNDEKNQRVALRRFRPPANAAIFISQDRHLQSDKVRGQIIDQSGPFLLSGNWWDEKSWACTEYDMQLDNSELVRAHECPPSSDYGVTGSAAGTWKLDGIYD